jgi:hypothetical protein
VIGTPVELERAALPPALVTLADDGRFLSKLPGVQCAGAKWRALGDNVAASDRSTGSVGAGVAASDRSTGSVRADVTDVASAVNSASGSPLPYNMLARADIGDISASNSQVLRSLAMVLLWVKGDAVLWDWCRGEIFHTITFEEVFDVVFVAPRYDASRETKWDLWWGAAQVEMQLLAHSA